MNNPDPISESNFVGILKFFGADPGWKNPNPGSEMKRIRIRDKHPKSATLVPCCIFTLSNIGNKKV
jgi:hypothetical protein